MPIDLLTQPISPIFFGRKTLPFAPIFTENMPPSDGRAAEVNQEIALGSTGKIGGTRCRQKNNHKPRSPKVGQHKHFTENVGFSPP